MQETLHVLGDVELAFVRLRKLNQAELLEVLLQNCRDVHVAISQFVRPALLRNGQVEDNFNQVNSQSCVDALDILKVAAQDDMDLAWGIHENILETAARQDVLRTP